MWSCRMNLTTPGRSSIYARLRRSLAPLIRMYNIRLFQAELPVCLPNPMFLCRLSPEQMIQEFPEYDVGKKWGTWNAVCNRSRRQWSHPYRSVLGISAHIPTTYYFMPDSPLHIELRDKHLKTVTCICSDFNKWFKKFSVGISTSSSSEE